VEIFGRRSSISPTGVAGEERSVERGKIVGRRGVSDVNVLGMSAV
jgi:hypothetical protein